MHLQRLLEGDLNTHLWASVPTCPKWAHYAPPGVNSEIQAHWNLEFRRRRRKLLLHVRVHVLFERVPSAVPLPCNRFSGVRFPAFAPPSLRLRNAGLFLTLLSIEDLVET